MLAVAVSETTVKKFQCLCFIVCFGETPPMLAVAVSETTVKKFQCLCFIVCFRW